MELRSKKKNKKFCYVQILNIAKSKKWLVIGLVLLSGLAYAGWESWTQLTAPADGDILAVQDISDTTQDATGTAKYLTLTTFWTEYLKGKADALYQPVFQSQTANYAFIAPNGSAGVPTFRALVVADISDLLSGNHTFTGNLTFDGTTTIGVPVWPDTATLPDEVGELRYVNNALSFTDGAFGWYDDDEVRYLIDTAMVDDTTGGTDALTNRPPSSNALYDVAQAKLNISDIDDTPVNSETAAPISSNWAYDHAALTAAHGVSGAVVGTTDTQALTNKDISSDTNTFPAIPPDMTMPLIACYNPQDVYDNDSTNHVLVLDPYTPAAQTITAIRVQCDVDPTTEPTLTFKFCTAGVGYGSATTIEAVQTATGVANVTSGIDDNTIPAGSKIFVTLDDPDDAILVQSIRIELDKD